MPNTISCIGANIQAYVVMQQTWRKYPLRNKLAQLVSTALRDTLSLFTADVFPAFDDAFVHTACLSNVQPADVSTSVTPRMAISLSSACVKTVGIVVFAALDQLSLLLSFVPLSLRHHL